MVQIKIKIITVGREREIDLTEKAAGLSLVVTMMVTSGNNSGSINHLIEPTTRY